MRIIPQQRLSAVSAADVAEVQLKMKSRLSPRTPPIIRRLSAPVAFALLLIALGAIPVWCQAGSGKPAKSKERVEAGKEKNKESEAEKALNAKYDAAVQDKNWPDAESTARQLIAQHPENWKYQKKLGDMQLNQGKYAKALTTYGKSLTPVQRGAAPYDDQSAPQSK